MAYTDFTLEQVTRKFQIELREEVLFNHVTPIEPSDYLKETLRLAELLHIGNERTRSERIISPILGEVMRLIDFRLKLFAGENLPGDPSMGLNGEVDYVVADSPVFIMLQGPLICVVEGKKDSMDSGVPQLIAQLIGAQRWNKAERNLTVPVYGCMTIAREWQFYRLEGQLLTQDLRVCYLNELDKILGILVWICNDYLENKAKQNK